MRGHLFVLVIFFVGGLAYPAVKDVASGDDMTIFFDNTVTNIDGRIVGGSTAADGAYPWMVAVTAGFDTLFFLCGGALITNRYVLSAAHCVNAVIGTSGTRVVVGTNAWNKDGTSYSLRNIGINPEYNAATRKNDVGLIGTAMEIAFNNRVSPITINYDVVTGGLPVRVTGWGWLQAGGTLSQELQELRMITYDGLTCVSEVRRVAESLGLIVPRVDPDLELCTFLTGNEGICMGDAGSPLVRISNNQLIGVASWGIPCARGAPDVFARVSPHRAWIETVLNFPIFPTALESSAEEE